MDWEGFEIAFTATTYFCVRRTCMPSQGRSQFTSSAHDCGEASDVELSDLTLFDGGPNHWRDL